MILVDDVGEGKTDGSQHVGPEPDGELRFWPGLNFYGGGVGVLEGLVVGCIDLEKDGLWIFVDDGDCFGNFGIDKDVAERY